MSKDVMSKIRAGDVWKALERVLNEYRIPRTDWTVDDVRPHPKLTVTYCGETRIMGFSGSPSSRNSWRAAEHELRGMLREMQMAAIAAAQTAPVARPVVKVITFRGIEIDTVTHDGKPFVSVKAIVDGMGLNWGSQYNRLQRDEVMARRIFMTKMVGTDGRERETVTIPLDRVNYFLAGIDASRVSPELKEGVIAYQEECADALARYWLHGAAIRETATALAEIPQHAILSREDMNTIGGIVKAVTGKQVADLRAELVEMLVGVAQRTAIAAPAYDLSSTVTSREMMDMAGVDRAGRVRGTTGIITRRMKDFCLARGFSADRTPAHIDPDTRWRFPRTAAHEWLFGSTLGAEVIRSHIVKSHRGHGLTLVQPSLALGGARA